jgi:hypothetical protein
VLDHLAGDFPDHFASAAVAGLTGDLDEVVAEFPETGVGPLSTALMAMEMLLPLLSNSSRAGCLVVSLVVIIVFSSTQSGRDSR